MVCVENGSFVAYSQATSEMVTHNFLLKSWMSVYFSCDEISVAVFFSPENED